MPKRLINSQEFINVLIESAVVEPYTRRVIIEAELGNTVTIYSERFGDERLIELVPALHAAVVLDETPAPESEEERRAFDAASEIVRDVDPDDIPF